MGFFKVPIRLVYATSIAVRTQFRFISWYLGSGDAYRNNAGDSTLYRLQRLLTDQPTECGLQPIFPILGRIRVGRRYVHAEEAFPTACSLLNQGEQRVEGLDLLLWATRISLSFSIALPLSSSVSAEYVDTDIGKQLVAFGGGNDVFCPRIAQISAGASDRLQNTPGGAGPGSIDPDRRYNVRSSAGDRRARRSLVGSPTPR